MKRITLTIVCILFLMTVSAQRTDTVKAQKGGFSTELNVNLFQGELNFNNALEQIKIRYLFSDQWALRAAFSIDNRKKTDEINQPYGTYPYLNENTMKTFSYSLGAGFEYRFRGTRRLSPYIGAEAWFGRKKSSQTIEDLERTTKVEGAWLEYYTTQQGRYYVEKGYKTGGVNLLAGFDFYVAKNFYVGYEFIVLGLSSTKYDTVDVTETQKLPGKNPTNPSNPSPVTDGKSFKFGPSLLNGIRIGYYF